MNAHLVDLLAGMVLLLAPERVLHQFRQNDVNFLAVSLHLFLNQTPHHHRPLAQLRHLLLI